MDTVVILVIGLVVGVILTARSAREVMDTLTPITHCYILFGLLLFGATWALQGWGMAAVLVAYGLYQIIGRRAGGIANIMSWLHLKKKPGHDPEIDQAPAPPQEAPSVVRQNRDGQYPEPSMGNAEEGPPTSPVRQPEPLMGGPNLTEPPLIADVKENPYGGGDPEGRDPAHGG